MKKLSLEETSKKVDYRGLSINVEGLKTSGEDDGKPFELILWSYNIALFDPRDLLMFENHFPYVSLPKAMTCYQIVECTYEVFIDQILAAHVNAVKTYTKKTNEEILDEIMSKHWYNDINREVEFEEKFSNFYSEDLCRMITYGELLDHAASMVRQFHGNMALAFLATVCKYKPLPIFKEERNEDIIELLQKRSFPPD